MKYSKDILKRITGPEILKREPRDMTFEQAVVHFEGLGLRYEIEERAAILEYDGGLSRTAAEVQAVQEMFDCKRS